MAQFYYFSVVVHAVHLGIDPNTSDREFLWLVEEARVAPLPAGWSEHSCDINCPAPVYRNLQDPHVAESESVVYYYNRQSGESAWEHPMDDYYRKLLR